MNDAIQVPILRQYPLDESMYGWPVAYIHLLVVNAYVRAFFLPQLLVLFGSQRRSTQQDHCGSLYPLSYLCHKELGQSSWSSTDQIASLRFPGYVGLEIVPSSHLCGLLLPLSYPAPAVSITDICFSGSLLVF